MQVFQTTRTTAVYALTLTLWATAVWGPADVNLEYREVPQDCTEVLAVDLYAVSDSAGNQSIASLDVVVAWDPAALTFLGYDTGQTYPYNWLYTGFPVAHPSGLNETWDDGDAMFMAYSQLQEAAAEATPDGLWVTRFQFDKLQIGGSTIVELEIDGLASIVYDGEHPGVEITGTLEPITVVPWAPGDCNCDGEYNAFDIDAFVRALSDPAAYEAAHPNCNVGTADCNCDGLINALDIDPFVVVLTTANDDD